MSFVTDSEVSLSKDAIGKVCFTLTVSVIGLMFVSRVRPCLTERVTCKRTDFPDRIEQDNCHHRGLSLHSLLVLWLYDPTVLVSKPKVFAFSFVE